MLMKLSYKLTILSVVMLFMTGCATTQIKSVWKDPSYLARPQKVVVIAVLKEPIYRRIVEEEFVLQFKLHGVDAIASYTSLPDKQQEDQAVIEKVVKQTGADSVLVTRMVSKRSVRVYYPAEVTYRPHYYRRWPEYYRYGYDAFTRPGYSTKYDYALMETNLYDVSMDHLVWAATTETGANNLNQALIKPYIGSLMKLMADYGLVRD
jgi:hypothetical protein